MITNILQEPGIKTLLELGVVCEDGRGDLGMCVCVLASVSWVVCAGERGCGGECGGGWVR